MNTKAVIFDLDGTLYDNSKLPFYVILRCLFNLRLLAAERAARRELAGLFLGSGDAVYAELFRRMARYTRKSEQKAERWYHEAFMPAQAKSLRRHMHPKPWAKTVLADLRSQGVKTVCFSDYGYISEKLQALGIDPGLFDLIIDAPSAGGCKPCREAFLNVASMVDASPSEVIVVGDREDNDGEGARACGMRYVSVPQKDTYKLKLEL